MKTTSIQLEQYADQMESIVTHAKSIGFSFETGNFHDLMRSWINMGRKLHQDINDNKDEVIQMLKHKCLKK